MPRIAPKGKMSLLDIMRGLIFAFSSCLLASAYFTFVFKVKPFLLQRDPKKLRPKPFDKDVINEILDADEGSQAGGETCDWLNVGLKWVFVDLFPIPRVRASIEAVIQEMLQGFKRGSTGYFVRQVELLDLDYGQHPPMMLRPRVITKPATHNGITTLAFDLKYTGGLVLVAKLDLIGDWQVFLRMRLSELSGPAYLMLRDTDVYYGLRTMDRVKLNTQLVINGVQFRLVNWVVGRLLMVDAVRRKLVFPAMKSHFMVPPDTLKEWLASQQPQSTQKQNTNL